MRMWMVDPRSMCDKHLLGEHGEIHKHLHNFQKKHRIDGRMHPVVQIEPKSMQARHDELAEEMVLRGMNHRSPYEQPDISHLPKEYQEAEVDTNISIADLYHRCEVCRNKMKSKVNLKQ